MKKKIVLLLIACGVIATGPVRYGLLCFAQEEDASGEMKQEETQALRLLRRGQALMEDRQEDRAVKVFRAVQLNFPTSPVRFRAGLELGKYHEEKGEYELAVKALLPIAESQDADAEERAEALYLIGICRYGENDYPRALSTLRRVTEEYPWSVYANEAYYYIGLCHFREERWWKAVEALKLVGTSVEPNTEPRTLMETGQRFFVKVHDKDLRVLKITGTTFSVDILTDSGDKETLQLSIFDKEGEYYLGAIQTALGAAVPGDGTLELKGGDTARVVYVDKNTQAGEKDVKRLGVARAVSTATTGFMDGAYREYVKGVFPEQKTFLRVKDFDSDTSDERDSVTVRLYAQYKPPREEGETIDVLEAAAPEYTLRDQVRVRLTETGPHTGFFAGTIVLEETKDPATVDKQDVKLTAVEKDQVCLEYVDQEHIGGLDDPRTVTAKAEFLTGRIPDVMVAHREVSDYDLRARKNLVEAQFYLKLAKIFRNVGLMDRSHSKANIGLEKVNDVIRESVNMNISRDILEESYKVKWELLLAKGDLAGAIEACRTLMTLYPASSLADVALMQIARANLEAGESRNALQILDAILNLKSTTDLKAEAQFLKSQVLEDQAGRMRTEEQQMLAMGRAVKAYEQCADQYPNSPFAGEALGKVIDFHLEAKNYQRVEELLQKVFLDYPDAPFLDTMLLKWGVVLFRMNQYGQSAEKLRQLLRDYPNSPASGQARKILDIVEKRA